MCPGTIPRRRFGQLHGSPTRLAWVGHRPCGVTQMIGAPATGNGRSPVACLCQPRLVAAKIAPAMPARNSKVGQGDSGLRHHRGFLRRWRGRHHAIDQLYPRSPPFIVIFRICSTISYLATNGRPAREVRTGLFSNTDDCGRSGATSTTQAAGAGTSTSPCSEEPRGSPDRRSLPHRCRCGRLGRLGVSRSGVTLRGAGRSGSVAGFGGAADSFQPAAGTGGATCPSCSTMVRALRLAADGALDRELGGLVVVLLDLGVVGRLPVDEHAHRDEQILGLGLGDRALGDGSRQPPGPRRAGPGRTSARPAWRP